VCEQVRKRGWQVNQADESRAGPYAYGGDQWVSYNDISSIRRTSEFIRSFDIGGEAVWSLDADDFRNRCGQCRVRPLQSAAAQHQPRSANPFIGQRRLRLLNHSNKVDSGEMDELCLLSVE
jgi:GH18 family chitinase